VKPRPWDISITKKTPATIEVDLIESRNWRRQHGKAIPSTNIGSRDLRRANADKLSLTNLVMNKAWDISEADPQWKKWLSRGVTSVLIIAHCRGTFRPVRQTLVGFSCRSINVPGKIRQFASMFSTRKFDPSRRRGRLLRSTDSTVSNRLQLSDRFSESVWIIMSGWSASFWLRGVGRA